jgi:hypothetical protein
MLEASQYNLELIFDTEVTLSTELDDAPRELHVAEARRLSSQLETIREQLTQWLISQRRDGG